MDRDYLDGLVDLLQELRAAKEQAHGDTVNAAYAKLSKHARSMETLYHFLHECRNELKASPEMDGVIGWLAGDHRGGIHETYSAIWEQMIQTPVMAELERWQASETLSSIVPELAVFDRQPDVGRMFSILDCAHVAARYAVENHLPAETKKKIKRLFWGEYELALSVMRDFLNGLELTREERNRRHGQLESLYRETWELLHESLDANTCDHDRFGDLVKESALIWLGLGFEMESYENCVIDPATRMLVPKKRPPARGRGGGSAVDSNQEKQTPKTDTSLVYQADGEDFYNIPKSTLSKAAKKSPAEPGYLWSDTDGRRRWYRRADLERLSRSRKKLGGT